MEDEPKYNYQKIRDSGKKENNEEIIDTVERPSSSDVEGVHLAESQGYECDKCKTDVSFDESVCPNCGADISDVEDIDETESTVSTITNEQITEPRAGNPILNRYRDLYRVAQVLVGIGNAVKIIGIVIGGFVLLIGLSMASSAGIAGLFLGALVGSFYGGIIFLFGLMISAQGQMLLAQADSAVHTSPFMTKDEKAVVMSVPIISEQAESIVAKEGVTT